MGRKRRNRPNGTSPQCGADASLAGALHQASAATRQAAFLAGALNLEVRSPRAVLYLVILLDKFMTSVDTSRLAAGMV